MHRLSFLPLLTAVAMVFATSGLAHAQDSPTVEPLAKAHAHNDYWHQRPLLDALDHGFTSVEADVFLLDGRLLVGHDPEELRADRTLEALYLDPLSRRVARNRGHVYETPSQFLLLIDIKNDLTAVRAQLLKLLQKHQGILTKTVNGKTQPGAVTVVLSGEAPREQLGAGGVVLAGADGRLADLEGTLPPVAAMPLISDRWSSHFTWKGEGPMPMAERQRLREVVAEAHQNNRLVRFWGAPDRRRVWRELHQAGVDLLNTDDLPGLAAFLREK